MWTRQAVRDLVRLRAYIALENPIAAARIAREIVLAGDSLAQFPQRGRLGRASGSRELLAARPYILVYEIAEDDTVDILRVWHGAQLRE